MIAEGESSVRIVVGGDGEAEEVATAHPPTTVGVEKAEYDFLDDERKADKRDCV